MAVPCTCQARRHGLAGTHSTAPSVMSRATAAGMFQPHVCNRVFRHICIVAITVAGVSGAMLPARGVSPAGAVFVNELPSSRRC